MKPSIIVSDDVITVVCLNSGTQVQFTSDHPSYARLCKAIAQGTLTEDKVKELYNPVKQVVNLMKEVSTSVSGLVVKNGQVLFNDEGLPRVITDRILDMVNKGLPLEPMAKFLERLSRNPSKRSVTQLYEFMENEALPIMEDGRFLAYKGIRQDWYDKWTGKIKNSIGKVIKMPRNKVCDDPERPCAPGLHVGSLMYAGGYGCRSIIVAVDPEHVVCVPKCEAHKCRTCEYQVVAEYAGPLDRSPVYTDETQPVNYTDVAFIGLDEVDWDFDDALEDDYYCEDDC